MPRKKIKCSRCSRTFSMPAHLARHMNTTHASPAARAARQRMGIGAGRGVRRGSSTVMAGGDVSFADSADLLSGIQAYHETLLAKRDQIDLELSALGGALSALGSASGSPVRVGAPKRGRRGSGAREGSLKNYIEKVLDRQSTPATPKDIASKVLQSGYQSRAKDLTKAVSNALPELKRIKKVGFGKYILK